MESDLFKEHFEVRDTEIDIQGIVNHSNYMIYLSHARHKYLHQVGIDFSEYAAKGLNLLVLSCNVNFKYALRPSDQFYVTCETRPSSSPIKCSFYQEIRLLQNDKLALNAEFIATCVNEKATKRSEKIFVPDELKKLYCSAE
jgi:acyl-CoA thioester hydrolase